MSQDQAGLLQVANDKCDNELWTKRVEMFTLTCTWYGERRAVEGEELGRGSWEVGFFTLGWE